MSQEEIKKPTEFELEILKVLWRLGPSTARRVLEDMAARRVVAYTTVLKMLQIMEEKGLVAVDRAERSHTFRAVLEREAVLDGMVGDLLDRVFDGAADEMLVHLVRSRGLGAVEIKAFEKRIAELRKKEGGRRG